MLATLHAQDGEARRDNSTWRGLALVLSLAVAVRVAHFCALLADPSLQDLFILDSRVYDEMANAMLAHGLMGGREVFGHAPLYPWLLAILRGTTPADGADATVVIALQQAMAVASVALTARITRHAFGARASLAAAGLFALYGAGAMLETKLMPSTLGVFLALSSLLALLESRERGSPGLALLAGLLLGGTCLARPNSLLFAPLAAAWLLWPGREAQAGTPSRWRPGPGAVRGCALFTLGVALAIAPVTLRNHSLGGEWVLITAHGGMTFYQSNNPAATGIYSRIPGAVGNPRQLAATLREIAETQAGHGLEMPQVDRYWRDRALGFLARDPLRSLALVGKKLRFWLGNDEVSTEYVLETERELTPSLWLMPVPFAAILGFAVLGAQCASREQTGRRARWLLYGFVAMNLASTAIFYFSSRYRLPAVPLLCGFAGLGVVRLFERGVAWDFARALWLLPGLAIGILSLHAWTDDYPRYAAHQWFNYGLVYHERAMFPQAAESHRRALEKLGDQWHVHYALARAYGELSRTADAIRHYERALQLRPQSRNVRRGLEAARTKLAERER